MKTLMVLVAVLWAGTGWAGHITHDGCNTCEQMGPSVYQCTAMLCVDQAEIQAFERKMEVHKNEDCLDKMEAAMRAMDATFREVDSGLSKGLLVLIRPDVREQWDAVKRECWRNP